MYYENTGSATSLPSSRAPAAPTRSTARTSGLRGARARRPRRRRRPRPRGRRGDGIFDYYENLAAGDLILAERRGEPARRPGRRARSALALGDLDGDGDLDLVAGESDGVFDTIANTGGATLPAFAQRTGSANPLERSGRRHSARRPRSATSTATAISISSPARTTASSTTSRTPAPRRPPAFASRTGSANPSNGRTWGASPTAALGDLDSDGDLDLVAGENDGVFDYYENTGTAARAGLRARTGSAEPAPGQDVGLAPRPRSTTSTATATSTSSRARRSAAFVYFENTGSATAPAFVLRTGSANPLAASGRRQRRRARARRPRRGRRSRRRRRRAVRHLPLLRERDRSPAPRYVGPVPIPLAAWTWASSPRPPRRSRRRRRPGLRGERELRDRRDPLLREHRRRDLAERDRAHRRREPFNGLECGHPPHLVFGDVDADGDLDLVSGELTAATARYFENTGNAIAPAFVERTGAANPFAGIAPGRTAPAFGDLDGDGDLDVVAGQFNGSFDYYENTAAPRVPRSSSAPAARTRSTGPRRGGFSTPALGDVDRDGDLDLVAGDEANGQFHYFENTGTGHRLRLRRGARAPRTRSTARTSVSTPRRPSSTSTRTAIPTSSRASATARCSRTSCPARGTARARRGRRVLAWLARGAGARLIGVSR